MGYSKKAGKKFKIGNDVITLYPMGTLSQKFNDCGIPRNTQTLRFWIKRGILPTPIFKNGKVHPKNLFTMEQIDLIVNTALECKIRQGMALEDTDFRTKIWQRMSELNIKYIKN